MNKKIKIIGLINNIYNDFNIPKKIYYEYPDSLFGETFIWNEEEKWYFTKDKEAMLRVDKDRLSEEVYIFEEKKEIEKIGNNWWANSATGNEAILKQKIDDLIDEIKKLKGDKDYE